MQTKLLASSSGAALVLLASLATSFSASAEDYSDGKYYTGASCKAAGSIRNQDYFKTTTTSIQNISSKARTVICPLVTESDYAYWGVPVDGKGKLYVFLDYSDAQYGRTECTAEVIDGGTGQIVESVEWYANGNAGDPSHLLLFPDLTQGGLHSPVGLKCTLPPMVKIRAISLVETTPIPE